MNKEKLSKRLFDSLDGRLWLIRNEVGGGLGLISFGT